MTLLSRAISQYKERNYEMALLLFQEAGKVYGENLVRVNIERCKREISSRSGAAQKMIQVLGGGAEIENSDVRSTFDRAGRNEADNAFRLSSKDHLGGSLAQLITVDFKVDQIYIVNLKRRPDRYIRVLREMTAHGLAVKRVDAEDAKTSLLAKSLHDAFRSRPVRDRMYSSLHVSDKVMERYKNELSPAVFGYLVSQRKVFQDALECGHQRILVLDDDVFFSTQAIDSLRCLRDLAEDGFKILMLGASEYADRASDSFKSAYSLKYGRCYHPFPGETCGSFAVMYDRNIFPEMIAAIDEADGTFDNVALGSIYTRYPNECYVIDPAVCIPDVGDSDIRPNSRVQVKHSERMKWEFDRYETFTRPFNVVVVVNSFSALRYIEALKGCLSSKIFLTIYYLSEDGLRPVIVGHLFRPLDVAPLDVVACNGLEFREQINKLRIPFADAILLWPAFRELTEDAILAAVCEAMQCKNSFGITEGSASGVLYCLDAGISHVKGKHSIIVPAFRSVDQVWPSIRSALLQDADSFEVIVVLDNPAHVNFIEELNRRVSDCQREHGGLPLGARLSVVKHSKNRNASGARNTGLMHSAGEFITFLDDDDFFESNRISAMVPVLTALDGIVGACFCGYTGAWNGNKDMGRFPEGDLGDLILTLRYSEHYMCTNTVTFTRSTLSKLGGFNEGYIRHQDLELMARFFSYFEIRALKQFLVRNRPASVDETFLPDVQKLCAIKHQFLTDMRDKINARGDVFREKAIDAHLADIVKRDKELPPVAATVIRKFLAAALDGTVRC